MKFATFLALAFAALALVIAFVVGMSVLEYPDDVVFSKRFLSEEDQADQRNNGYLRKSFFFFSDKVKLHAWMFYPDRERHPNPTTIIISNAAVLQKDIRLNPFVESLTSAGYGVFTFDYRGFGGSDGEPRHVVEPQHQLTDLKSAIDFVLDFVPNVNKKEIGLWGMSLGGGHVAMAAATHPRKNLIKAVVVSEGMTDGFAVARNILHTIPGHQLFVAFGFVSRDLIRRLANLPPSYVPIITTKDTDEGLPNLLGEDASKRLEALLPLDQESSLGGWRNLIAAGSLAKIPFYRPVKYAADITAPVLSIITELDELHPVEMQQAFAAALPAGKSKVCLLKKAKLFDTLVKRFDETIECASSFFRENLRRNQP